MTAETILMRDNRLVTDLVMRARVGDKQAWDALVQRYASLVWSICRRNRLGREDAEDVFQDVWLRLVDQLDRLRDPAALPGWLATTTQRECGRILGAARRLQALGPIPEAENISDQQAETAEEEVLAAERHAALREAFAHLPPDNQRLLALLIQDPPVSYAEISARLGIPIGSIGPTRSRCLAKLRRYPAIAALITARSQRGRCAERGKSRGAMKGKGQFQAGLRDFGSDATTRSYESMSRSVTI